MPTGSILRSLLPETKLMMYTVTAAYECVPYLTAAS